MTASARRNLSAVAQRANAKRQGNPVTAIFSLAGLPGGTRTDSLEPMRQVPSEIDGRCRCATLRNDLPRGAAVRHLVNPSVDARVQTIASGRRIVHSRNDEANQMIQETEVLSSLIGTIYDTTLDRALWPEVLKRSAEFVGGAASALYSKNTVRQ